MRQHTVDTPIRCTRNLSSNLYATALLHCTTALNYITVPSSAALLHCTTLSCTTPLHHAPLNDSTAPRAAGLHCITPHSTRRQITTPLHHDTALLHCITTLHYSAASRHCSGVAWVASRHCTTSAIRTTRPTTAPRITPTLVHSLEGGIISHRKRRQII